MEQYNPACQSQAPYDNGAQPESHFRFTDLPRELRDTILGHVLDYLREKSDLAGEPEVDEEPASEAEHYEIKAELRAILAASHNMFALSCEALALDDNTAIRALQNEINALNNERIEIVELAKMVTESKTLAPAFDNTVVPDNLAPVPQSLATLACVSKEWQKFFEAHTFRNLDLSFNRNSTDLVFLGDMVKGYRVAFVENICLHIKLRGHSSDDNQADTETEIRKNNVLFTIALVLLFETLAKWTDPKRKSGLKLHINVWSPDDYEDWPPRWQGSLLDFIPMELPLVPIVDDFAWAFCSKSTRSASANAIGILLQSMNRLSGVNYHSHYSQPGEAQSLQDDAFLLLFQKHSGWMKRMVVREGAFFSKEDNQYKTNSEDLELACFNASLHLESLITARVVDAFDFFRCTGDLGESNMSPRQDWPELITLVLSCDLSSSTFAEDAVDTVLLAAGKAAMRMPKLERMITWSWDTKNKVGFFFQYARSRNEPHAVMSILTTWRSAPSQEVVECWTEAAMEHRSYELSVGHRSLDRRDDSLVDKWLKGLET